MKRDTVRRLNFASGYLGLGLLNEAAEELERIDFSDRFEPPVLAVRLELHLAAKHWDIVAGVAKELAAQIPTNERAWICRAQALKELGRIEEAKAALMEAEAMLRSPPAQIYYDLARYHCLLGGLAAARDRLAQACQADARLKGPALDEPDLQALWQ